MELTALVAAATVSSGIALATAAVWGRRPTAQRGKGARYVAGLGPAITIGLVVGAVTRMVGAGLIVAIGLWCVQSHSVGVRARAAETAKATAVEEWVRRLSDVLVVGMGLGQAIASSARTSPPAIRPEVEALVARLQARSDLTTALTGFAESVKDPGADLAVASLILAGRRRGPGLAAALQSVSDAVAADVGRRRVIDSDRAKQRATARAVTVITLAVVALGLVNGEYVAPYRDVVGQVALIAIATVFGSALLMMNALANGNRPEPLAFTQVGPR